MTTARSPFNKLIPTQLCLITHAITMRPDEEGFEYPVVDSEKCVRCYKCISVCPIKAKDGEKE